MNKLSTIELVLVTKNDRYHDDNIDRITFCLRYNLNKIYNANLQFRINITIIDWCSDINLAKSIDLGISYSNVKFYYLNNDDLSISGFNKDDINISAGINVAIIRSKADYIFTGSCDLLLQSEDWSRLVFGVNKLGEDRLGLIKRKIMPSTFFGKFTGRPIYEGDIDYLIENYYNPAYELTGGGGGAGLIGASRKHLIELHGFNESIRGWGGNDNDIFMRSSEISKPLNLSEELGIFSYKFPYHPFGERKSKLQSFAKGWGPMRQRNDEWGMSGRIISTDKPNRFSDKDNTYTPNNSWPIPNGEIKLIAALACLQRPSVEINQSLQMADTVRNSMMDLVLLIGHFSCSEVLGACFGSRAAALIWIIPQLTSDSYVVLENARCFLSVSDEAHPFVGSINIFTHDAPQLLSRVGDVIKGRKSIHLISHINDTTMISQSCSHDEIMMILEKIKNNDDNKYTVSFGKRYSSLNNNIINNIKNLLIYYIFNNLGPRGTKLFFNIIRYLNNRVNI